MQRYNEMFGEDDTEITVTERDGDESEHGEPTYDVSYSTSKYGVPFSIDGKLKPKDIGREFSDYEFEPGETPDDEEGAAIWSEHWEDIEQELISHIPEQA